MREFGGHLEKLAHSASAVEPTGSWLRGARSQRSILGYAGGLCRPLIVTLPGMTTQIPCGNESK